MAAREDAGGIVSGGILVVSNNDDDADVWVQQRYCEPACCKNAFSCSAEAKARRGLRWQQGREEQV